MCKKLIDPQRKCPNCETPMEYRIKEKLSDNGHDTHVWICEDCPLITFEYYVDQNIEDLKEILK